ncbi:acyl-CoA thioesterase [Lacinutrix jangbogonensis]|uniref:acyl-CoA thioesterase n=1 Tax=Lacinutrix jangbogonensis TaxID=1469557 RepID=UPI00053D5F28|nr:thioesterase family protein [Lacinutrix jangbogonensis]
MQNFTKTLTVTKEDLDELNHVNNVRYIEWVNDIAKSHWLEKVSKSITETYFWVLISHTIEYKRAAVLGNEILLNTYITNTAGATTTRIVEIYNNKTQAILAKSETKWCFMSYSNNKPLRISDEIKNIFS